MYKNIKIIYSKVMSEYRLYRSNRLKSFIKKHNNVLGAGSLFGEKSLLVIQNRSIGEWLKLELAETQGISANLNIVLPENAVRTLVRSFPLGREMLSRGEEKGDKAVLFMDNLKIIIYKRLEELLHTDSRETGTSKAVFAELESYVKGLGSGDKDFQSINSLRLYQLSDSIAGLFYYYGMNCRELISCWERGEPFFSPQSDPTLLKHERWQMALWKDLFNDKSPYVHLSRILSAIVDSEDQYDGEPLRIVLFGSTFMGDSSLRFFHYLSRFIPVEHFTLSPSSKRVDFESPLLKDWGSLYSGFSSLMTSLNRESSEQAESSFEENEKGTLLSEIQNDLLYDRISGEKRAVSPDDKSLTVVSTTGKWRETEALKNRILKLLDTNPDLKLTDIGVLAPDINEYAHFIEAVFPSKDSAPLPYNIIDLSGEGDSPFISGFLGLLNLAGSRFTRKELFSLFANRCYAAREGIGPAEYSAWLDLCDQINIRWGIDGEHKKELNVAGSGYNSWESGFERVLEGMALSEEEDPFGAPFELFGEGDNYSAGKLIHTVRSLHMDINSLISVKLRLEEWVLIWESVMDTYLRPADEEGRDERDRLRLKGCFRDILNMVNELGGLADKENRLFDFFMFKSLLTEFINKSGGSKGRYLSQGISCSSLKPLRAVPFKVIMVLGLNEEAFPASDEALSFDLKDTDEVKEIISIDLSRRTSDKYSFLEVFLSAEEQVFLFYTGRNNVDNEALQPSSLITELAAYINDNFEREGVEHCFDSLVEEEKLQPFDRAYFTGESGLFSYSRRDFELAETFYGEKKAQTEDKVEYLSPGEDELIELTFRDLLAFVRNPLKTFFNKSCGVYMEDQQLLEEEIDEKIEPDFFLEREYYRELLFSSSFKASDLDLYRQIQSARGEFIDNELSIPAIDRLRETTEKLLARRESDARLSSRPEPVVLTFGEKTDLTRNQIESPLITLGDGKSIAIRGSLPPLYLYPDKTILSYDFLGGSSPQFRHWLNPYLLNMLLPHELKREKGLYSALVGQDKIHKIQFPIETSGQLDELLSVYRFNSLQPLPLYPEIAEKLVLKKEPVVVHQKPEELAALFLQSWVDKEGERDNGFSPFKSCPYRTKAYHALPLIQEEQLMSLLNCLYVGIRKAQLESNDL